MKLRIWLDSGANIHSKREVITSPDELGLTDEEWREMSEDEKEVMMRDVAFEQSDWGWREIE